MRKLIVMSAVALAVVCLTPPLSGQTPTPQTPTPQTPTAPAQPPTSMPALPPATASPTTQTPTPVTPAPSAAVPTGTTGTTSIADTEHGTEILLLDRVQKVLDGAADGKAGAVTIDRGVLDELRAEVSQVKASLQAAKK